MNSVIKTLINFGLSENEAVVYKEAIKVDETNPFALSKATGIPRTTMYEIITSLSLKGLVELKRSNGLSKQQTTLVARNPSALRTIINRRHHELTQLDADIVHILPELKADFQKSSPNADCQFFPGIDGARKVFEASKLDDIDLPEYLFNYKIPDDVFGREYMNKIIDDSIHVKKTYKPKEIMPLTDWTKHCVTSHYARNPKYLDITDCRYINQSHFDFSVRMSVKGDRIWTISVENDECWATIQKSVSLANSFISFFNVMWVTATPLTDEKVKEWIL